MRHSADRLSGVCCLILSVFAYLIVIPRYVDQRVEGTLNPDTLPNILCIIIAGCSLALIFRPGPHPMPDPKLMRGVGFYFAMLCAAVLAMRWFGYVVISPFLALMTMLMVGERRPLWIVVGVAFIPALIWFSVEVILSRSLP